MTLRIIGALLLIVGCGGIGYTMVAISRREVRLLDQMERTLDYIISDLQWQQNSLPKIIREQMDLTTGYMKLILREYAAQLEAQIAPNASCCMEAAISCFPDIPGRAKKYLVELGESLGRFDLQGQLQSLQRIKMNCGTELTILKNRLPDYTKCCQAYSLCIGVILTLILF